MKRTLLFLLLSVGLFASLSSQEVAPFEFSDKEAITIDKEVLKMLVDKTWKSYKQYTVLGEESEEYGVGFMTFTLKPNHTFQAIGKGSINNEGTWEVKKRELLHLKIASNHPSGKEKAMGGAYVIYEISDTTLIFVKNLTSDLKSKIVYYCKSIEMRDLVVRTVKNTTPPVIDTKIAIPKAVTIKNPEDMTQEELKRQLREELFMRALNPPKNFDELTREELLEIHRRIVNGIYRE